MNKVLELREWARNELGDAFDLRDFHDQFIGNANLSLSLLEQVIADCIAEQRG